MDDDLYNQIIQAKDNTIIIHLADFKLNDKKISCLMSEDFPNEFSDAIELYTLKSYKWLVSYLKDKEDNKSYFGEITQALHNVFVKNPRPYRKNIKAHLVDLLDCIKKITYQVLK